ncbi:MAG TPA: FAD-dependent oxidoreductase [Xanthobacteraceae bacterium]|nr:FAD-dependent oxidoreductase [Xanthobacteraceae bacterium]
MKPGAVIVGASHAGVQAAVSLRQSGWQEPIHLLSNEHDLPYHRPPLSKAFLSGTRTAEQILLRGEGLYREQGLDLLLGCSVREIDPVRRRVSSDAGVFDYSKLIIATGARARDLSLPGIKLGGVHILRNMADARALKLALESAHSLVVIGGGFIGLEVAATAATNSKQVTVLEAQDRLLARALPPRFSHFLTKYHAGKGVRFVFNVRVDGIEGASGRVSAVKLADGGRISADLVLIAVGGAPSVELGQDVGLTLAAGGIAVDDHARTSAPDIYAIGDCAAARTRFADGIVRVESVQNAVDQARAAAAHCAGQPQPLAAAPWFWTDQYDLKIQMAGLMSSGCEEILRGDPPAGAFTLLQLKDERLISAFSVNRAADHMAARRLIDTGVTIDRTLAARPDIPLLQAVSAPTSCGERR